VASIAGIFPKEKGGVRLCPAMTKTYFKTISRIRIFPQPEKVWEEAFKSPCGKGGLRGF
jgi:hypothetical protein